MIRLREGDGANGQPFRDKSARRSHELQKLLVEAQNAKKRASTGFEDGGVARSWLTAATVRLRPKTMQSYIWRVEHHILPVIGNIAVNELTAAHLDTLYGDLASNGALQIITG